MKIPFILVLLAFSSIASFGQNTIVIDSLLNKLETAQEDTIKVEILLRLFNPTVVNDLDLAYEYTEEAHRLSEKLSFDKGIAAALQRKGIIWGYRGNIEKARENYLKAIEVHKRLDHEVVVATLIHNLGMLFQEQGIYDSAIIYCERAAKIFLDHQDSLKYASSLDLLATIHDEQGNYFLTLKYATEAAKLFHKYGDELREADALVKIGDGYEVQNNYQSAIQYYNQAIELYQKHNDQHWANFTVQKLASTYLALGKIEKADSIIDKSVIISDSLGAVQTLSEAYSIKGDIYFNRRDYGQALSYFEKALESNKAAADSTFIATQFISIGRCYQSLGMFEKARKSYLAVLPISLRMDVKENIRTIYFQLSEIYEQENNVGMAFSYYKKFTEVKDKIYNEETSRQIADMQTKYNTEQKEREIEVQNQKITILEQKAEIQNLIQMRLIVSIIVVIFVFLLLFYVFWLRMKRKRLKQEIENERLFHELNLKKRELTTRTLHIIQKNELLENLQNKISEIDKKENSGGGVYKEITRIIRNNKTIEKDWENFKSVFEQVHPTFFTKLRSKYDKISSNELRMAAMMKMNLNTKEMASILNITPESVKKARYRLRKKFELEPEAKVEDFLMKI
jgi:tetratricopeptide (TPR) repeat protein